MAKLKLNEILDDRPVKLSVELTAAVHRDLVAYASAVERETGQMVEPAKLVGPMLTRFMASDRAFAKVRKGGAYRQRVSPALSANSGGKGP